MVADSPLLVPAAPYFTGRLPYSFLRCRLSRSSTRWIRRSTWAWKGPPPLADLPVLLQALIMLLASDFLQYWIPPRFHYAPLWKFHAVHHSPVNLDWLSAARFHPINIILYSTLVNVVVYMMGFSPQTWLDTHALSTLFIRRWCTPISTGPTGRSAMCWRARCSTDGTTRIPRKGESQELRSDLPPFSILMFGTFYMPKGVTPCQFRHQIRPRALRQTSSGSLSTRSLSISASSFLRLPFGALRANNALPC